MGRKKPRRYWLQQLASARNLLAGRDISAPIDIFALAVPPHASHVRRRSVSTMPGGGVSMSLHVAVIDFRHTIPSLSVTMCWVNRSGASSPLHSEFAELERGE